MIETVKFRHIAPLYNFDSDIDGDIELDQHTMIRRITPQEQERMLDRDLGPQIPAFTIFDLQFVAELIFESRRENPFEDVDRLVSALRLFKPGNVSFNQVKVSPSPRKSGLMGGTLTRFTEPEIIPGATAYKLNQTDVEALKTFWSEFRSRDLTSPPTFGVALRRFNFGYGRVQLEDRLLDFMIAFEALLLKEYERDKMHKLAARSASLLGTDSADRRRISGEMKGFYKQRSALVHGRVAPQLTAERVAKIEDSLRQGIRKMLVLLTTKGHGEILEELDQEPI